MTPELLGDLSDRTTCLDQIQDLAPELHNHIAAVLEHQGLRPAGSDRLRPKLRRVPRGDGRGVPRCLRPLEVHGQPLDGGRHASRQRGASWSSSAATSPSVRTRIARSEVGIVIWKKDRTLPWSNGRRFRNLFEYVLFLVKTDDHKFKVDRLRDFEFSEWWLRWPERYNPSGRQPSNVWEIPIPVQGSWRTPTIPHVCPLPEELVKRMVLLSTDPGDVVFDPFAGTGVVLSVAKALGRKSAGLDIEPAYARALRDRSTESEIEDSGSETRAAAVRRMLIQLRALKYPKVMFQRLIRSSSHPAPQSILVRVGRIDGRTLRDGRSAPVRVDITFAYPDADGIDLGEITESLRAFAARPPLSKFGVDASVEASRLESVDDQLLKRRLHVYESGHTWVTRKTVCGLDGIRRLETPVARRNQYSYPPIVSNVKLRIEDAAASPEQSVIP